MLGLYVRYSYVVTITLLVELQDFLLMNSARPGSVSYITYYQSTIEGITVIINGFIYGTTHKARLYLIDKLSDYNATMWMLLVSAMKHAEIR